MKEHVVNFSEEPVCTTGTESRPLLGTTKDSLYKTLMVKLGCPVIPSEPEPIQIPVPVRLSAVPFNGSVPRQIVSGGGGKTTLIWSEPSVSWCVASGYCQNREARSTKYLEWSDESKRSIEQLNSEQLNGNSQWCQGQVVPTVTVPVLERSPRTSVPVPIPNAESTVKGPTSQYLTLPEAAALLGKGGRKPSTNTIWRWTRHGCRGIMLKYHRFGRQIRVTEDALAEFSRALAESDRTLDSPHPTAHTPSPQPRNAARRAKEIAESETFLRNRGLM